MYSLFLAASAEGRRAIYRIHNKSATLFACETNAQKAQLAREHRFLQCQVRKSKMSTIGERCLSKLSDPFGTEKWGHLFRHASWRLSSARQARRLVPTPAFAGKHIQASSSLEKRARRDTSPGPPRLPTKAIRLAPLSPNIHTNPILPHPASLSASLRRSFISPPLAGRFPDS